MKRQTDTSIGQRANPRALQVGLAVFAGFLGVATATVLSAQNAPAGAGSRLPVGPGRDLFVSSCSQCHAVDMAVAKRHSPDEWREVMNKMVGKGAQISDADFEVIHGYLAQNFAPVRPAGPPPPPATPKATAARFARPTGPAQWPAYGGGGQNQNYSPLTQITPANVAKLRPAWTYHYGAGSWDTGDQGLDYRFEVTPLMIGGVIYISTPASPRLPDLKASITALKPETGEVLWKYESPLNIHGRGVAYWPGDASTAPRIFFATDQGYLMAVDVTTGQLAQDFGAKGQIDAYIGVASEIVGESRRDTYTVPNPVTIYKNLIITGARPGEIGPPQPRGDIRAFDAKTGRLVWTFHTVPQPGEPGHETYKGDEWRDVSGANVWSTMALDEENGIVYAPTGDLNGDASGSQLYSSSLLALDANTGKLKWYHQITHHDMWDFDSPTPPTLFDYVDADGKTIPALLLTGKQSQMFLYNRLTGETLNGVAERPTPRPDPGQVGEVWPTQPMPEWPAPLARVQMSRAEVADVAPGMKAACTKFWDDNNIVGVPLYAPRQSSEHNIVTYPSSTGGPNWGGGTYNPDTGLFIINVKNTAGYREKVDPSAGIGGMSRAPRNPSARRPDRNGPRAAPPFTFPYQGINLSCGATPWGELVAVDVRKKTIAWRVPLGMTEALGAKGANTGAPNLGGLISTKAGLTFVGATNDHRFRAFDSKTGKKLWETSLEASGHAAPITYMGADGKQYVVIAAGGGTSVGAPHMSDAVVAYRLP